MGLLLMAGRVDPVLREATHAVEAELTDLRALRDAIPGDDKRLVAEWVVKIATQHLISTDRTRYVTAERLNALDALMDATDACPPSVRAALRTAPIPWWVHPGKSIYPTEGTDCPTWEAATPAPIRRRFTMNTIENVTIAKMGGAIVVGSSGGHPSSSLALCVSWLCFDDERWVDVEMKSGHHLTTYGEATDE